MQAKRYLTAGALLLAAVLLAVPARPAAAADFNGDGVGDIAIFRPASGLWAIRGVTRLYFGSSGDTPVPGDYNGNRIDAPAIFRPTSGLWAVRGVTRVYFGGGADQPKPGDYTGDGKTDFAIFRPASGLWAVRGMTRFYFGVTTDIVIDPGPPSRRGLLKTGQAFTDADEDDGFYQAGVAFSYYTEAPYLAYPEDVVTVDRVTGLMWTSDGDGYGCNNGDPINWIGAVAWARDNNHAGYRDWRLPNLRELQSLVNTGRHSPALDPIFFPNTRSGSTNGYWTSSGRAGNRAEAWIVRFSEGIVQHTPKSNTFHVRLVRGGR